MASSYSRSRESRYYNSFMSRKRLSSLISAVIFVVILLIVLDRLHIVIWVQTPWWALILGAVVLFLLIDFAVSRVIDRN